MAELSDCGDKLQTTLRYFKFGLKTVLNCLGNGTVFTRFAALTITENNSFEFTNAMRNIFKSQEHNLAFHSDGYVLVDALDSGTIGRMEQFFLESTEQDFTGCLTSLGLRSPDQKEKIYESLTPVFDDHLSRYVDNYRAIAGTFVSKKSDAGSVVPLHRDWAFVNEAAHTSVGLWIPLCETDANNGALTVLKGSHKLKQNFRGSNIPPRINFSADAAAQYLTLLPMKPGWVLFYDHRLIHGSAANRSGRQRTAASITLVPAEATPLHYLGTKAGVFEFEVDAEFFHHCHLEKATEANGDGRFSYSLKTDGYPSRKIDYTEVSIDEQDLVSLYEPHAISALKNFKNKLKARIPF